ncbi:MAG: sugar transferase [Bacteroidetes bacterium]|nr:MAG: sugar transferase [Bacteroidota bacterium]
MYQKFFKRFLDLAVVLIILVISSPFWILAIILVPLTSSGPIFFKQERVAKGLKRMYVYKFRTMTHKEREVASQPILGKDEGVTHVGYLLRKFKIDEIPQLGNILIGEMSLIGPRPSIPLQLAAMTEEQKRRYSVKPGLTGLAQVSGNIHLSWPERYVKDLEYIDHLSFAIDVKIILRTIVLIFRGEKYYLNKKMNIRR